MSTVYQYNVRDRDKIESHGESRFHNYTSAVLHIAIVTHCDDIDAANVVTLTDEQVFITKCHPYHRYPKDTLFARAAVRNEIEIIRECSKLTQWPTLHPNFVSNYGTYKRSTRVSRIHGLETPSHAYYTVNEYFRGGTMEHFLMDSKRPTPTRAEWVACVGQFLAAHATLTGVLQVSHGDLHWGNILFTQELPGSKPYCYHFEGDSFYMPDQPWRWALWDFGQSRKLTHRTRYEWEADNERDLENIIESLSMPDLRVKPPKDLLRAITMPRRFPEKAPPALTLLRNARDMFGFFHRDPSHLDNEYEHVNIRFPEGESI